MRRCPALFWCMTMLLMMGDISASIPPQHLHQVQNSLLAVLGFEERPTMQPTKANLTDVHPTIKAIYEKQLDFEYDTTSLPLPGAHTQGANTVRSFTHVKDNDEKETNTYYNIHLKFNLSSIPENEVLQAAEVKLSRELLDLDVRQRIFAIDIIRRKVKGVVYKWPNIITSQIINTGENSTVTMDIFPAVQHWLRDPSTNHGIRIRVSAPKKHTRPLRHLKLQQSEKDDWATEQPLLLVYTDDGKNQQKTGEDLAKMRPRRGTRRGHRKNEQDPCRRRKMYVNFTDVGWSDWIVAPPGYDAYFCDGECEYPMAEHMNTTNHAIVQVLMNSARPNDVPKPCCVPTSLSAISMLYVGSEGNVILKNYKDMVVMGCGCR